MNSSWRTMVLISALVLLAGCDAMMKFKLGPTAKEYGQAWANHDIDKIMSMHTDDSIFVFHFNGQKVARGKKQIREEFEKIFWSSPDYRAEVQAIYFGANSITLRYVAHATPTKPIKLGNLEFVPSGKATTMELVDVLVFEGKQVAEKHTYADIQALYDNSVRVVSAESNTDANETTNRNRM